ncbi:Uncharacterized protein LW93_13782 [Fusarium fujikuroi]|nr:Uncharacterized protein LW93_13782 [Fusarium fujikuroi]
MENESKIDVKTTQEPTTGSRASVVVCEDAQPVPASPLKRFLYHLWDNDQHLKSPEERKLVRKLDFGILICATLGWWMKYIDQNNIVNAYVSGMKEDLDIQGNEYTYMLMCYTIAFAIMQIPSNAIALKIRPRICIVVCELGWTIFTFAQAAATSSNQMYAFRFMIGLFESGFSPIIIFLLGSWYNKAELAKRMAIWHITGFFGSATSGFLQAAVHRTLDGSLGLAGWRWMYIIALSVWWFLPDLPHNTKAWYITEEEKQIALRRSATQGKVQTWANEINVGNAEERALTISSMNGLFYATNSFLPILIFPQTMAPKFERGFPSVLSFALGACGLMFGMLFFMTKDFMLRQNNSFAISDRSSDLQRPVFQQWGLNESLWRQQKTTEDIDEAAVEPVLSDLEGSN